jgi:hypothetical protein
MATGESFPYRVEGVDSNGVLYGYGYTFSGENETKASIKGKIDKQGRKLTFKEIEIISSHYVPTRAFMCLLQATLADGRGGLKGAVVSKESDNTACTAGELTFTETKQVNDLFSSHDKYDMAVEMGGPKAKAKAVTPDDEKSKAQAEKPIEKVTVGIEKEYDWHHDVVVLNVWDGGTYDGDVVTIIMDGKPVLRKYLIVKEKYKVNIPLPNDGTVHTIEVVAENEGYSPPNTANISLTDGDITYNLLSYNKQGDRSIIRISRAK